MVCHYARREEFSRPAFHSNPDISQSLHHQLPSSGIYTKSKHGSPIRSTFLSSQFLLLCSRGGDRCIDTCSRNLTVYLAASPSMMATHVHPCKPRVIKPFLSPKSIRRGWLVGLYWHLPCRNPLPLLLNLATCETAKRLPVCLCVSQPATEPKLLHSRTS